jgi:hypothetical protein
VFASWMIINPIYLSKAVDGMDWDALVAPETTSAEGAELTRLRADVDQLLARAAR